MDRLAATPDLDAWLAEPAVRTHRCRAAAAAPDVLWRTARQIRLSDTGALSRVIRWRIPDTPRGHTYDELFRGYPFTVLEEGERHLVSGLCGRIWTLARDYPQLAGPDEFLAWEERGTVRVVFAHWVRPAGEGAVLCSEARVKPVDRASAFRLRALWRLIGHFEPLIAAEPLSLAARRARGG